jgi:hypothetical protein
VNDKAVVRENERGCSDDLVQAQVKTVLGTTALSVEEPDKGGFTKRVAVV